jgi:hypothetical protein
VLKSIPPFAAATAGAEAINGLAGRTSRCVEFEIDIHHIRMAARRVNSGARQPRTPEGQAHAKAHKWYVDAIAVSAPNCAAPGESEGPPRMRGGGRLLHGLAIAALAAVALAVSVLVVSTDSLEPKERAAMLTTCNRLGGNDRALCRQVVDDLNVGANTKRSCLQAMTAMLQGSTWARVKDLPPTLTCRYGLGRAGYPVQDVVQRLTGAK